MKVVLEDGREFECNEQDKHEGGEGIVYFTTDGQWAVKIYKRAGDTGFKRRVLEEVMGRFNAVKGSEYWRRYFCWPEGIVKSPSFGVLMPRARKSISLWVT